MILTKEQYEKLPEHLKPYLAKCEDLVGWGTQLKPAQEPIVLARKPIKQTIAKNCQEYGVGALNIDATRVPFEDNDDVDEYQNNCDGPAIRSKAKDGDSSGMFEGKTGFKHQKKDIPSGGANGANRLTFGSEPIKNEPGETYTPNTIGRFPSNVIGEIAEPYSKYFYNPKVSRAERHSGMGDVEPFKREEGITDNGSNGVQILHKRDPQEFKGNNHPTVKPVKLMEYLIKLVTPKGGHVLDPFNGSGSTGMAAVSNGYQYTGIDLDPNYCEISRKRIETYCKPDLDPNLFETTEEEIETP